MYRCGDKVVYGIHGVCKIVNLEVRSVEKKRVEYYVLEPLEQPDAKYYIPTQNQAAVAKLSPLLTQQELDGMLAAQTEEDVWIADENQRKQIYKKLITGGDRAALIRMVHTLHKHKQEQLSAGRKFHLCDENFLRDAEKRLNSEFSLVLNIQQSEVGEYIQKGLKD